MIAFVLVVLLFAAAAVPAMAAGFDMDSAIAEFEQTPFNAKTLKVGQTTSHPAAVWTNTGRTFCYSSDEAVVTVDASGKVTAVGEGQAYVAVVVEGASYNLCRYDVTSSVNTENSVNDKLEDYMNRWEDDNSYEKSYEEYSATRRQFEQRHQQRKTIILVIATLVIFLLVFIFGSIIHLSVTSMQQKSLPEVRHTSNTVTTPMAPRQYCMQCGQIYGSADFCPKCGSAKVVPNTYVVPINGRITAQKLETVVNEWLAENPYAYDCKLKLETKSSLLIPFVQCKFFVKRAEIEFFVADKAPEAEDRNSNQQKNTQKLDRVAKLVASLRKIGNRNERHIQNDFGNQPTDINRKIAKNQSPHHRQRIGQHIGCVQRRHPQTVNDKFGQQ